MILIGDENIAYENISLITSIDDIKNTKANSTIIFDFNIDILKYTQTNNIKTAVKVNNIKEVIYASTLDAFYIIPTKNILIQTQKIADNYMFDCKVLATIESSDEIQEMALNSIDGIIYKSLI